MIEAPWPEGAQAGAGVFANEPPRTHIEVLDPDIRLIAEHAEPDRLGHADDRIREHLALRVGRGNLDQGGDRLRGGVEYLLDDACELGIRAQ